MSEERLKIIPQQVDPRIWRYSGPDTMCSCSVFLGDRAVLVADSMVTPGLARQVKAAIRQITDRPIRYLLITHGDSDHVFGNQEFESESTIIAHKLTRDRLIRDGEKEVALGRVRRPNLAAELAEVRSVAPDVGFDENLEIDLGGLQLECLYVGPAHTSGDVAVWAPEQRFLFTADVVFNRIFPVLRNGDIDGWLRALDRLEALRPAFVAPGHGDVGGPELLGEMRELLTTVRDEVRAAIGTGLPVEKAVETITFPQYRSLPRAEERIPEAVQRIYAMARASN